MEMTLKCRIARIFIDNLDTADRSAIEDPMKNNIFTKRRSSPKSDRTATPSQSLLHLVSRKVMWVPEDGYLVEMAVSKYKLNPRFVSDRKRDLEVIRSIAESCAVELQTIKKGDEKEAYAAMLARVGELSGASSRRKPRDAS